MMAYTNNSMPNTEWIHQYFCGKCVLRNRGWAVEAIADPDGGMLLTNLQLSAVTASGVKVTWRTSKASDSRVDYGPGGLTSNKQSATATVNHTVTLTGLTASTEYQVQVTSKTADNESTVSRVITFKTGPIVIGGVAAAPAQTTAQIAFNTDRPATSKVDYGRSQTLGSSVAGASKTAHTIQLTGLTANTIYRYKITCTDARGVETSTAIATFKTTA
jgi:hypothetical protein